MKPFLAPLLSLLLIACSSEATPVPPPAGSGDATAQPAAAAPADAGKTADEDSGQPNPDANRPAATPTAATQTAATDTAGTQTATTPAAGGDQGAVGPVTAGPTPPTVLKTPSPPPQVTVQMPTVPPLPTPVVETPKMGVDPHTLSSKNLGGAMKIHGAEVTENDLRRYLCYGVGGKHLDALKFEIISRQEIAKRKEAGEDVSALVVSDAEVDKMLEKQRKDFLLKYPTLDFPTEVGRAYLSLDVYRDEVRRTLLFDKIFFPEDPEKWPSVTSEAIIMASSGRDFIDDSIESYKARKQMMVDQNLEELPPDDPLLVDTLRSWVLEALNSFSLIQSDVTTLPADTLMIVEGVPIKVDQVWKVIEPHVTWDQIAHGRRFLALLGVAEHELTKLGMMIPKEEFEANFMPNVPYANALVAYEMVALVLQGFPSMQANVRYERALRSYKKSIAEELASNEKLQPYLQRANQIAGAAKIDAEVILSSAYDYPNSRWKVDGWKSAETKARSLKKQLDEGAEWGDILELHSDFWDPPMPEVGQKPQFGMTFKGRFGTHTRNQFVGDLTESDFTTFVTGRCIADKIFFEQQGGTISDVLEGEKGYYIARVNSRSPAGSGLNLQVPVNRDFLVNFVSMSRFGAFARQLLTDAIAKGEVSGF